MTLLEVNRFDSSGWAAVAQPASLDEAITVAQAHGHGFYLFTSRTTYHHEVNWIVIGDGITWDLGPGVI